MGNAPRQRRQWDERQTGLLSNLTWASTDWLTLDGGINLEHQDKRVPSLPLQLQRADELRRPAGAHPERRRLHPDNFGTYVQAVIQPTEQLKIIPAYRLDRFSGETELPAASRPTCRTTAGFASPSLSVVYSLTPDLNVYANWGRTFQILTGSREPAYLTAGQKAFKPSIINTGKEVGCGSTRSTAPKRASPCGSRTPPTKWPTCPAPAPPSASAIPAGAGSTCN